MSTLAIVAYTIAIVALTVLGIVAIVFGYRLRVTKSRRTKK